MELLGTDDPIKSQLLKKSAQHREELEHDVQLISDRTQRVITNALVIGGALALTYFVVHRYKRAVRLQPCLYGASNHLHIREQGLQ